jgi:hypothetical protein
MSVLKRFGTACTVNETTTTRASNGQVTTTSTTHTGIAYRQKAKASVQALNPSVSGEIIVQLNDSYKVKTRDTITHNGVTSQVLSVHTVETGAGVQYQLLGV